MQEEKNAFLPQADETASTQDRLLQAGIELFSRHGFEATTTRMVAEAVGANNAAVYFYYGSKENFYEQVLNTVAAEAQRTYAPLRQEIAQARSAGPLSPVKAWHYIEKYVDLILKLLKNPRDSHVMYLLLHEQLTPVNSHRPITRVACQQGEMILDNLLLDYWGLHNPFAAAIVSRLATSSLIALVEHPTFLRIALELDEDAPLPQEAWQDIRGYTLSALRSFVPNMPADGSGQKELTRYREIFEQRENP